MSNSVAQSIQRLKLACSNNKIQNRNNVNLPLLVQNRSSKYPNFQDFKIINQPDPNTIRYINQELIDGPYSSRIEYENKKKEKKSLNKSKSKSKIKDCYSSFNQKPNSANIHADSKMLVATVNRSSSNISTEKHSLSRRSVSNKRSNSRNNKSKQGRRYSSKYG